MARNEQGFREICLRPQMGEKVEHPELVTTILGSRLSSPVILAPCGLSQVMSPNGALSAARAAKAFGTISTLSTVAGISPSAFVNEPGPRWFQLYAPSRDVAELLISEARNARFEALMVTLDTPALGKRERDARNGVHSPLRLDPRSTIRLGSQVLLKPRWALQMAKAGIKFGPKSQPESTEDQSAGKKMLTMQASPFSWEDVAWIKDLWAGPLIVKGVMSDSDALRSVDCGADLVVVSNHGGRQLEGVQATIKVLPEVVKAVGSKVEVLVDSGVRRGSDVVKAMCLGARGVLIGRPYLYGLSCGGQDGVSRVLEILRSEMERTMILMGCRSVSDLGPDWLQDTNQ